MDQKTKSIIIGLGSAFAAVMVIILLFFAISGMTGNNKVDTVSGNNANDVNENDTVSENVVESDGNLVVPFDDSQPDDTDTTSSNTADTTSSDDVSSEPTVTNAAHFGRSDIDSLSNSADKFSEFVSAVNPVSYEWNTQNMGAASEVTVKLIASDGSYAVIGVPYESSDYTVGGEKSGSGSDVTGWTVYKASKSNSCTLLEVVLFSNTMKFDMPRGIKVGTRYDAVTAAYLNLSTAEKTYLLYEGTDVLTDSAKLKSYKQYKSAYIGGKIYKLATYLSSFYKDNNEAYPFNGKCNNIIRYGYNSLGDTSEATGQWYIEYATKDHKVVGVRFYNASVLD